MIEIELTQETEDTHLCLNSTIYDFAIIVLDGIDEGIVTLVQVTAGHHAALPHLILHTPNLHTQVPSQPTSSVLTFIMKATIQNNT